MRERERELRDIAAGGYRCMAHMAKKGLCCRERDRERERERKIERELRDIVAGGYRSRDVQRAVLVKESCGI